MMGSKKESKILETILTEVPVYLQKVKCDTDERTPPFKCAVASCPNYFRSVKDREKQRYKFHRFPKDRSVANLWKIKCGIKGHTDVNNKMVCSDHFYLDDYQRNYKEEFMNPSFKRELKPNAIPTQNLGGAFINSQVPGNSTNQTRGKPSGGFTNDHSYNVYGMQEGLDEADVKQTVDLNESLRKEHKELSAKLNTLRKKSEQLHKTTAIYKKKLQQHRNNAIESEEIYKVFTPSQIRLLSGAKKVYWTDDDLARAFTLRHIGGRDCYLYLKNTVNMPLPALSCVQRWASSE